MAVCLKCQHDGAAGLAACPNCGAVYAKLQAVVQNGGVIRSVAVQTAAEREAMRTALQRAEAPRLHTTADLLEHARRTGSWNGVAPEVVRQEAAGVLLATTDSIPGRTVAEMRGLIAADYAYAFGAILEEVAGLARNIIGSGVSNKMAQAIAAGRNEALHALRFAALDAGANAVVGVRVDCEEFSGANQRGTLVVCVTGTAVRLEPAGL